MKDEEFAFAPPGRFAHLFLLLLGLAFPMAALTALALAAPVRQWLPALPAVLAMPLLMAWLGWAMHRRRLRLRDGYLHYGRMPWQRAAVAALDLEAARILDLGQQRGLQPVWRLAGTALPGYRSGWFRLRDRRRAYVVLSDWRRTLVLPKRDGGLLLFDLQRPEAVLAALRHRDSRGAGR